MIFLVILNFISLIVSELEHCFLCLLTIGISPVCRLHAHTLGLFLIETKFTVLKNGSSCFYKFSFLDHASLICQFLLYNL